MAIADSTLRVDIWTEIRSKLVTAAPYVTNSSTSATTAASINASYKDSTTTTKPQVVINPIDMDESVYKFGGTQGKKIINVMIDCYADTSLGADQLSDQVKATLDVNTILGIDLVGVTTSPAFVNPQQLKYHINNMVFSYIRE